MSELKIKISSEFLDAFCKRYHVRRMSLFGSVLRDDYQANSDVDVLVQFDPDARVGFMTLGKMQRELTTIFQRPVDLIPQDGLKPVIRNEVLASVREVYAPERLYLVDILEAADAIQRFIEPINEDEFLSDELR